MMIFWLNHLNFLTQSMIQIMINYSKRITNLMIEKVVRINVEREKYIC